MAKIDRLERLDQRRADLELEYRETLTATLERTLGGKPGLFNHRADKREQAAVAPVIGELRELGDAIDAIRAQLMVEPFALHRDFFDARGPVAPSAVGEPKQARQWLDRLELERLASGPR
ncbi:MAG: hypothetical protein M3Q88_01455 [Pseudomonadota bacterium]|nr:hypothetical protein [Pseudomonadota bacterium]